MKKSSQTKEYLEIKHLAQCEPTPELSAKLERILTNSSSLIVTESIGIILQHNLKTLIPKMELAFERFMEDGSETDKECKAKLAIIKALNIFDYCEDRVFIKGVTYIQEEPVYIGRPGAPSPIEMEDTAIDLRCECAFGLARMNHPSALYILADLFADKEEKVRSSAAKTLGYIGELECEMMLRVKIISGDKPVVMGECFTALMTMAPKQSINFVARYLQDDNSYIVELAAIAIGNSHLPEALTILKTCWDNNPYPMIRRSLLLPIALIRSDDAFDFLIGVIPTADKKTVMELLDALKLYSEEKYVHRIKDAIDQRSEREIHDKFRQEFAY